MLSDLIIIVNAYTLRQPLSIVVLTANGPQADGASARSYCVERVLTVSDEHQTALLFWDGSEFLHMLDNKNKLFDYDTNSKVRDHIRSHLDGVINAVSRLIFYPCCLDF